MGKKKPMTHNAIRDRLKNTGGSRDTHTHETDARNRNSTDLHKETGHWSHKSPISDHQFTMRQSE